MNLQIKCIQLNFNIYAISCRKSHDPIDTNLLFSCDYLIMIGKSSSAKIYSYIAMIIWLCVKIIDVRNEQELVIITWRFRDKITVATYIMRMLTIN